MQHVIRHWQGSLTEADSTAAMQMDAEFDKASNAGTRSQTRDLSDTGQLLLRAQFAFDFQHTLPSQILLYRAKV